MAKKENEEKQEPLFGEQDFVYNTINGHVLDTNDEISRLLKSKDRIDDKVKQLKEQKKKDLEALDIVGKEIKKLRPDEEKEEEIPDAEVVEDGEKTEGEKEETDEEPDEPF